MNRMTARHNAVRLRLFTACAVGPIVVGCGHSAPTPVATNSAATAVATPVPGPTATVSNRQPGVATVQRGLVGNWARGDGVIRASFTSRGNYILYVVHVPGGTGHTVAGRPAPPVSRNSHGTYKLLDNGHVQFTNHGRTMTNGIAINGNAMTLTDPDGSTQQWTRLP